MTDLSLDNQGMNNAYASIAQNIIKNITDIGCICVLSFYLILIPIASKNFTNSGLSSPQEEKRDIGL